MRGYISVVQKSDNQKEKIAYGFNLNTNYPTEGILEQQRLNIIANRTDISNFGADESVVTNGYVSDKLGDAKGNIKHISISDRVKWIEILDFLKYFKSIQYAEF